MRKRLGVLVSAFLIFGLTLGTSFMGSASATVPGNNTLVSVNNTGNGQGGDGNSNPLNTWADPQISSDGNIVAFRSASTNLVTGDTNGKDDYFLRNLSADTTTRVDVSTSGVQADTGADSSDTGPKLALSKTGRYVVFASKATNLVDGTTITSIHPQVYIHDMQTGTTSLISQTSGGTLANYGAYNVDGVSSDGRFVLFGSSSNNLGVTLTGTNDEYLYRADRQNGTFQVLNTTSLNAYQPTALFASMSCDGTIVADTEFQDSLTSDDTNTDDNVYLFDLRNGTTVTNLSGSAISYQPTVSCNGDFVAFQHSDSHAYVYNRVTGTSSLADQSSGGVTGNNSVSGMPSVDDNGDTVFQSSATNLISGTTSPGGEVYLHNYLTGTTEMLSKNSSGTSGNSGGGVPVISANGKLAAYDSYSTNLISSDTNGMKDTFTSQTGL